MNTYANAILKGPQREAIVDYLLAHTQRAFVGPTVEGLTFVYTPFDDWDGVAQGLSRGLQSPALFAYGYDSDVFGYRLYESGQIRDAYVSAPEFESATMDDIAGDDLELSSGPSGGDASALCRFVGVEQAIAAVDAILHPPVEGALLRAGIDAFNQHWALAEALGLPPRACVESYESLRVDEDARADLFGDTPVIETP